MIKNERKNLKKIKLFCDGSVNPQKKIGYGAYLLIDNDILEIETFKNRVVIKKFEDTSSTKLEMETFLWAINDVDLNNAIIEIYTDCQNIIGLIDRRKRLESNDYKSSKGKLINNHELYKLFFEKVDNLNLVFIKVKGHKKNSLKDEIDDIFNLVDKASRNALREELTNLK
jgi:ribonuclease HI